METKNSISSTSTLLDGNNPLDLKVIYQPISDLKLRSNNPRTHSPNQIEQLVKSITLFGFTNPILVDEDNTVIAGHGRVFAAQKLDMKKAPTICLSGLSEAEIRAYVIADNKLAENAGWDEDLLALEFSYLSELDIEFDLTVTGFETAEIDLLIEPVIEEVENIDELSSEAFNKPPISKLGDLWLLGKHRVLCGDATKSKDYSTLLDEQHAQLIFTDPPYNVPVQGHVSGLGAIKHDEFPMASGEMSKEEFKEFLSDVFRNLIQFSVSGSIHFVCIDWSHLSEMLSAGELYSELKNVCVWVKANGGMGSLYRSQHEFILIFKNGSAPHINNILLGKFGRYKTNVWQFAGANSFHEDRMEELHMHPTVKPLEMVKSAIQDCSNLGDLVLDPFGGSGTTLIAAEHANRVAYLMELDPRYVDVTLKRFIKITGLEPVLATTGQTFLKVANEREVLTSKTDEIIITNSNDELLNKSEKKEI
jgi:DNA modification methylase